MSASEGGGPSGPLSGGLSERGGPSGRGRAVRAGLVVVVVYAATAFTTLHLTARPVRPLFEGFTPAPPYQWVNPPAEFKAGNQKPSANETEVVLVEGGSKQAGVNSQDAQFVLNFREGAAPPTGTDTALLVRITPLDPSKLAAVPNGFRPDGNAYRVELLYRPSGQALAELVKPGNVVITVPDPTTTLLFAADGKAWERVPADLAGGAGALGAAFTKAGYYLAAEPASDGGTSSKRSDIPGVVLAAALTVALALALFFVPRALRRRRG